MLDKIGDNCKTKPLQKKFVLPRQRLFTGTFRSNNVSLFRAQQLVSGVWMLSNLKMSFVLSYNRIVGRGVDINEQEAIIALTPIS